MAHSRPNLLLIMCDQFRHDWLGYRGAGHVSTPHLDRLASRSRVFTQAVCNSPVCAPSRIGLALGVRPHRVGAMNNQAFLPLHRPTYYQRLRDHGYYVGCSGKLDLAKPDPYNGIRGDRPLTYSWGFTDPFECEGKMHAGRGNPPNGPYTHWLQSQGLLEAFTEDAARRRGDPTKLLAPSVLPTEAFADVFIGREARRMITAMPDDFPWHFFVSFVGPHDPFDPPVEYFQRFQDAPMPEAIAYRPDGRPDRYRVPAPPNADQIQRARQLYTAYVACLDDEVGKLMAMLDQTGRREQTYVIFCGDHGEMLGDHGRWTKSVHYESALRVPLAISGPGIEPGSSDALVELNDLNPTICQLLGVDPIPDIDARSLCPLLEGRTDSHRSFTMSTLRGHSCIRNHQWKAIIADNHQHELYRLDQDPDEQTNLIDQHREVFEQLNAHYVREWRGSPHGPAPC